MGLLLAVICMGLVLSTSAQVQSNTTATSGTPGAQEVTVDRGEVVAVSGNDLWIKMEDGEIRHISNVPESARATVDGKEIGIHDLQPGTKLQRTIATTATPMTVTRVENVAGTVFSVQPPASVILTLENGQNEEFSIPSGQKFMVNGQETDAWGLKKGMKVTATKTVEVPVTMYEQQKRVSGTVPPPPSNVPILIVRTNQ